MWRNKKGRSFPICGEKMRRRRQFTTLARIKGKNFPIWRSGEGRDCIFFERKEKEKRSILSLTGWEIARRRRAAAGEGDARVHSNHGFGGLRAGNGGYSGRLAGGAGDGADRDLCRVQAAERGPGDPAEVPRRPPEGTPPVPPGGSRRADGGLTAKKRAVCRNSAYRPFSVSKNLG